MLTNISVGVRRPSQSRSQHLNQYSKLMSLLLSSSLRMNHTKSSYPIMPALLDASRRGACIRQTRVWPLTDARAASVLTVQGTSD